MKRWIANVALVGCLGLLLPFPVAAAEPDATEPVPAAEAPAAGLPAPVLDAEDSLLEAFETILFEHYDLLDPDKLIQAAIKGMIDSLGDPFSSAMTPEEYQTFINAINADYAGVGLLLQPSDDGALTILQVYKGTPAEAAGLLAGDRILTVDGEPITKANAENASTLIMGPVGTKVTIQIQRGEGEPLSFKIERAKIDLPSVEGHDLGGGLGYIRILSMGDETTAEFKQVLSDLDQAKGIVLDLRSNGGGSVLSAVEIADELLDEGIILHIEDGSRERFAVEAEEGANPVPIVVLVDEHTASAAEILTGALQQNGRAMVVGTRTYGKGTMQTAFEQSSGGVLKLTTDHWFLPEGMSLHKVGLKPDRLIPTEELQLQAALHLLDPKRPLETAIPTLQQNGATYLPLRFALESLAVQVSWSPEDGTVSAVYGGQSIQIDPVAGSLKLDGEALSGEAPVMLIDGKTYISASAFVQVTGVDLEVREGQTYLRAQ